MTDPYQAEDVTPVLVTHLLQSGEDTPATHVDARSLMVSGAGRYIRLTYSDVERALSSSDCSIQRTLRDTSIP